MKFWGFYHNTYPQLLFSNKFSQCGNKNIWKIFEKKFELFLKKLKIWKFFPNFENHKKKINFKPFFKIKKI